MARPRAKPPTDDRPVLLVGVGNILYGDEGLGVYLAHRVRRDYDLPAGLEILDGGALGWHLLPHLAAARRVVIVDAVAAEVGTIYRFGHHDVPSAVHYGKLSSHEWEVPELLWAMEVHGDLPPTTIVAMGVDPAELHLDRLSMGLSAAVAARLPVLELVLLAELADAGMLLRPRRRPRRLPDPADIVRFGASQGARRDAASAGRDAARSRPAAPAKGPAGAPDDDPRRAAIAKVPRA